MPCKPRRCACWMPAERRSISCWSTCGRTWIALPPSARVRPGSRWSATRPGAAATAVGKSAARWSRQGRSCGLESCRKQVFQTILPLLSAGLFRPADGKRPARKDERLIREQVRALREAGEEADAYLAMTNLIEQVCNYSL